MGALLNITFLNPWLLAAFITLPLLYFVLRMLPPPPKDIVLATTRFLEKLTTQKRTTSKTPWWILLLRMLILACFILAFAHPVIKPDQEIRISNPLLLVLDNDWAAAQNWDQIRDSAANVIATAADADIPVALALTTPAIGQTNPRLFPLEDAQSALNRLPSLTPMPYEGTPDELVGLLNDSPLQMNDMDVVFISSGVRTQGSQALIQMLASFTNAHLITPEPAELPFTLSQDQIRLAKGRTEFMIERVAPAAPSQNFTILGQDTRDIITAQYNGQFSGNALAATLDISEQQEEDIRPVARYKIAGQSHAASLILQSGTPQQKRVGIATKEGQNPDLSLTQATSYLSKALSPYAKVSFDTAQQLVEKTSSYEVLIFPDVNTLELRQLDALEKWIAQGGILIRFSGDAMAQRDILPVATKMQLGVRALGGDITWEDAPTLDAFPSTSPLYGLEIRDRLTIRKQLLADPALLDENYVWAFLSDNTPFITARQIDNGFVTVIHTSADPSWSDFPLTGLYVDILQRILDLADSPLSAFNAEDNARGLFKPLAVLDGTGQLKNNTALLNNLAGFDASNLENIRPSSLTPPGLYSFQGKIVALNLGARLPALKPISALASSFTSSSQLTNEARYDFKPALLKLAIALFALDWLLMIYLMRFSGRSLRRIAPLALIITLCVLLSDTPAYAQDESDLPYIQDVHFAYVETRDLTLNTTVERGLENLIDVLVARTSIEPVSVVPINLNEDPILFYPFLYWRVAPLAEPLSAEAKTKIQNYMSNGGLIIVDFGNPAAIDFGATEMQSFLQTLEGVTLPPLRQIEDAHALKRSFYLLDTMYGAYSSPTTWVSYDSENPDTSVAALILGGNDWASAWARGTDDMAMRTGVNMTMYALTGNYKTDQLHLETILERLGQ